jgi:hypothetical protein
MTLAIWSSIGTRLTLPVTPAGKGHRFVLRRLESTILSEVPEIFSVFGEKQFQLLYRGKRDGFQASAFHKQCDGHPNTLTLILSNNDCIFGGYTPLTWSSQGDWVSDPSLKSFLFTIKNPHNLPPQRFTQNNESNAIYDNSTYGPTFGTGRDLYICDQCQSSNSSYSVLGTTYTNATGISGDTVLTGAKTFLVKEIEVFEVV